MTTSGTSARCGARNSTPCTTTSTRKWLGRRRTGRTTVLAKHTSFEYEEFTWARHRSFSASGDGPADVHWPEQDIEDSQRVSERREAYRATFSAGDDEYLTELDEATWRRLRTGKRYRLKVSTLSGEVKEVSPLRGSWR